MLSFFPELLNTNLGPTILRLVLAIFLFKHAANAFWKGDAVTFTVLKSLFLTKTAIIYNQVIGYLRVIAATLLLLGLFTQIAAFMALVMYILRLQTRKYHGEEAMVDSLLGVIAFALVFLGAGALSLDL